jgi:hypothetical protein
MLATPVTTFIRRGPEMLPAFAVERSYLARGRQLQLL